MPPYHTPDRPSDPRPLLPAPIPSPPRWTEWDEITTLLKEIEQANDDKQRVRPDFVTDRDTAILDHWPTIKAILQSLI